MSHFFKRRCAALLAVLSGIGLFGGAVGEAAAADFEGLLDVAGGKLQTVQMGNGPYTVIFEAGFGSDLSVWRKVAPELAKRQQVLLYSRAGTGQSPARAQPLDIDHSTAELEQLLAQAKLSPPYILVGHSYGGFLVRAFAARHPEQVAGMVYVDPADEGLETALKRIDADKVGQDRRAFAAMVPPKWQGDLQLVQRLLDDGALPPMGALPDVPAVLLTSVRTRDGAFQESPPAVKLKRERHQAFFSQFSNGAHVVTSASGHTIQLDEPELVIAAIDQVIAGATQAAQRRAKQQARTTLMAALEKAATAPDAKTQVAAALRQSGFGEAEINNVGFNVLTKGKQAKLAALILQYNAQEYAQSHNAADSHGEVLMALGRAAEAKLEYSRALALGKAGGAGARTLAAYQQNIDTAQKAIP